VRARVAQASHRATLCSVHLSIMQSVLSSADGPLSVDGMRPRATRASASCSSCTPRRRPDRRRREAPRVIHGAPALRWEGPVYLQSQGRPTSGEGPRWTSWTRSCSHAGSSA
jgi:hypothetical protein